MHLPFSLIVTCLAHYFSSAGSVNKCWIAKYQLVWKGCCRCIYICNAGYSTGYDLGVCSYMSSTVQKFHIYVIPCLVVCMYWEWMNLDFICTKPCIEMRTDHLPWFSLCMDYQMESHKKVVESSFINVVK